jgi:N-acetylglucosaminyl-diphospho-decaprenol L-rhamnosyltransferase
VRPDGDGPDLSVLIVSWNAREDLWRCLGALPAAAGSLTLEVVVVDNGSRDGTLEMLRSEHPEVRLIVRGDNPGFAGGINAGWPETSGWAVAVLNPDVFAHEGSLERLVGTMIEEPSVGLAGPEVVDTGGRVLVQDFRLPSVGSALARLPGVPALRRLLRRLLSRSAPARGLRTVERINGCCMAFRREALEATGGVPELTFLYGEEIVIGHALARAGYRVVYEPAARVTHRDGVSVDQVWAGGERQMLIRAARALVVTGTLGRFEGLVWNLVMLGRELIYALLGPVARAFGRRWPRVPLGEAAGLHVWGAVAAVVPAARHRLRSRYDRAVGRRHDPAPAAAPESAR